MESTFLLYKGNKREYMSRYVDMQIMENVVFRCLEVFSKSQIILKY